MQILIRWSYHFDDLLVGKLIELSAGDLKYELKLFACIVHKANVIWKLIYKLNEKAAFGIERT